MQETCLALIRGTIAHICNGGKEEWGIFNHYRISRRKYAMPDFKFSFFPLYYNLSF